MSRYLTMRIAILLLFFPLLSFAHPGGVDSHGGHTDRRTGEYHCHREPCLSAQQKQREAERQAEQEGRLFSTLYDRRDWPHWVDEDGNCRDTRAEVLIGSSRVPVTFRDARGCTVAAGEWLDPYSGELLYRADEIDIDHLVPLKHAHGHGGHAWPLNQRRRFANDETNLLAVSARLNRAKGSSSPDQWLPPNQDYWCEYGRRWRNVKGHYQLMITPPEEAVLITLEQHCPAL
ncbi:MAG: YHYH domain-containing protein [Alcanivoracaceae bacterium]